MFGLGRRAKHQPTTPLPPRHQDRPPRLVDGRVLTEAEFEDYIYSLKLQMREDLVQAEDYSDAWEYRKAQLTRDVEREAGHDAVILRARSREDTVLSDNMDGWWFFQRRALLYAGIIQAEMASRLGGYGM